MDRHELNQIFHELRLAGVRELRFIGENIAVDQLGRKIIFYRKKFGKYVKPTFRIQSS